MKGRTKKFNYTNRIKILRSDLLISIDRSCAIPRLEADIHLKNYRNKLPDIGKIYVEAYHRTRLDRFCFGTVGNPVVPKERNLHSFTVTDLEDIRFRVKIVDESGSHGQILAMADGVGSVSESERDANRLSLLGLDFEDLGNRIWRLDLERGGGVPWLVINSSIPDLVRFLHNNEMIFCMIYPELVRQILAYILLYGEEDWSVADTEDGTDEWQLNWLWFGRKLSGEKWPRRYHGGEKCSAWIENCVDCFCRTKKVMEMVRKALEVPE